MQKQRTAPLIAAGAITGIASLASAEFTGTITADNHYALYTEIDGTIGLIGGNETGAGGAPGTYNWSKAETWSFEAPDRIFIAAWSDDQVAQGLLADFDLDGMPLLSGDPVWDVYATGVDLDTGSPWPLAADIASHVATADLGELWEDPFSGPANLPGTGPWGAIDDISAEARWMWRDSPGDSNPLQGGQNHGEYLIFSAIIPAPGAVALLLLGPVPDRPASTPRLNRSPPSDIAVPRRGRSTSDRPLFLFAPPRSPLPLRLTSTWPDETELPFGDDGEGVNDSGVRAASEPPPRHHRMDAAQRARVSGGQEPRWPSKKEPRRPEGRRGS